MKKHRYRHNKKVKPIGLASNLVKEKDGSISFNIQKNEPDPINRGTMFGQIEPSIFQGFESWISVLNFLVKNKITRYEVKQGITDVEIKDDTIIVPPHLERIISEILKEIPQNE